MDQGTYGAIFEHILNKITSINHKLFEMYLSEDIEYRKAEAQFITIKVKNPGHYIFNFRFQLEVIYRELPFKKQNIMNVMNT